jgi:peptidoglycan/LPS O-acetylase OafA/YrhL
MNTVESSAKEALAPKQHFTILDGLRGIAALSVVTFHFMEMAITDYSKNFIAHGFLAVDFFFCLSGFVIAYAYDDRMSTLGVLKFIKARLIRLHPLVILGSVLGLLAFLYDPFVGLPVNYSNGKIFLIFLCSLLLIPLPIVKERAFNLFGFNAPAWSLFWEYVANIFYAIILWRLSRRVLIVLTIIAGVLLFYVTYRAGNIMGGWSGDNFWDGGARVSYSFLAGMLIYRSGWIIKNKLGFVGMSALLFLAFVMPFGQHNYITEPLVVLFYFPLIVALGAGAILSPGLRKICELSGNISYPLYMTHYAVLWMFGNWYSAHKPGSGQLALIIIAALVILTLFAWIVMKVYDTPLRRYLSRRYRKG